MQASKRQKSTFPANFSTFFSQSYKMVEKGLIHLFFHAPALVLPMVLSLLIENPIKIVLPVLITQFIF
jgi:hypothetical protein